MFAKRTYPMKCRVCERHFELVSEIGPGCLPLSWDGRYVGTCNMSEALPPHSRAEVRASFTKIGALTWER